MLDVKYGMNWMLLYPVEVKAPVTLYNYSVLYCSCDPALRGPTVGVVALSMRKIYKKELLRTVRNSAVPLSSDSNPLKFNRDCQAPWGF